MSVLAREQDSYQRALAAYQRQINQYNRSVDKYKATLVKDQNGNLLVVDSAGNISAVNAGGTLIGASLPRGFNRYNYGMSEIPGGQGFRQLRQGEPVERKVEVVSGLRQFSDEGGTSYYDPNGMYRSFGPDWQISQATAPVETWDSYTPATYTATRDASIYMAAPPEWKKEFNRKAPSATPAQAAKIGAPSLAEVESGLIGEVMKGKGVRYGVPVYRLKGDA